MVNSKVQDTEGIDVAAALTFATTAAAASSAQDYNSGSEIGFSFINVVVGPLKCPVAGFLFTSFNILTLPYTSEHSKDSHT